jgi:glycosyltransferase involved in cell wall biosynthesis
MNRKVSVVMPTLGGEGILTALQCLNTASMIPFEILICVPGDYVDKVPADLPPNAKIISCPGKGQVAQRAFGFSVAACELVLQLDDDIRLRHDCLEQLVALMGSRESIAVGPMLFDHNSGEYKSFLYPPTGELRFFETLLGRITNGRKGYEAGAITLSGINLGVPRHHDENQLIGWLPGGCILHHRNNLITEDYYPFEGKAFAEDLYHSNLLRKNNISLYRSSEAGVDVVFGDSSITLLGHIAGMKKYYAAMMKFCDEIGGSKPRFIVFLVLNLSRLLCLKLVSRNSS